MSNSSCWDVHPFLGQVAMNHTQMDRGRTWYYTKWPQSTTMKLSWSLLTGRWSQKGRTVGGSDLKNMLVKLMSQASGWKCKTVSPKKTPWSRTKETWNHWNLITHLSSLQLGPVALTQQYVECGEKLWLSEPQMNLSLKSFNTCGAAGVLAIQGWLLKDPNILRWVGGGTGFDSERVQYQNITKFPCVTSRNYDSHTTGLKCIDANYSELNRVDGYSSERTFSYGHWMLYRCTDHCSSCMYGSDIPC